MVVTAKWLGGGVIFCGHSVLTIVLKDVGE